MLLCLLLLEDEQDRALVQELYSRYKDGMYRVALRILMDEDRAQDAVQDAFFSICKNFSKIKRISCLEMRPYIVTIVRNIALNMLKRDRRRRTEDLDEVWRWEEPSRFSTEEEFGYRRVLEAISSMPEVYRRALELKFVLECSDAEIARELGISVGAAAMRVRRGRVKLIELLKEEGYADV